MQLRSSLRSSLIPLAVTAWVAAGCGEGPEPPQDTPVSDEPVALGPVDGFDLPAEDLSRVAVGGEAPDFALEAFSGDVIRLSDFRGQKNVVLVFYRGHW